MKKNEVSFTNEISFFQLLTVYISKKYTNCLSKKISNYYIYISMRVNRLTDKYR